MTTVEFHGLTLATDPGRVWTPRPTTEALVEAALARIGEAPVRVADVGTGSGAVAVAIAVSAPGAEVWASDTSPLAIALAQKNAALHNVKVQVLEGALLDPLPGSFDLIVANLPYLAEDEPDERYAGEPAEAVYAPGDGLGLYRLLVAAAPARLSPGGTLLVQLHGRVVEPLEI